MFTNITRHLTLIINIAAFTFFSSPASAQHEAHQHETGERAAIMTATPVSGVVQCADGPALPGAIVQLFAGSNTNAPAKASALTDQAGRFQMTVPAGDYHLRVTYLGHATLEKQLQISTGSLNIGSVRLQISAVELDALVAAVEKDRVRLRAGKTVFEVDKSTTSAGGSVADALRNVPGLDIGVDGRIAMRGSSGVQLLINGQRTALKDEALVAFLRQMPANALKNIEASTSADAAQDADGTAGVVNLVFAAGTSQNQKAYSLTASGATAGQYMASASAIGSLGSLSWDAAYALSTMQPRTVSHTMRDNWLAPASLRTSHQLSVADATHQLHSVSAGSILRLGAANAVNGRLAYSWMRGSFDNRTDFADISSAGARTGEYAVGSTLTHTIPTAEAEIGWSYRNNGPRRFALTTSARAGGGEERFEGEYAHADGAVFLDTRMTSERSEYAVTSEGALDVAGMRVTLGQKAQWRSVSASYDVVRDTTGTESFTHDERVQAAYATASRLIGSLYIEAGTRLEAERQRIAVTEAPATERSDVRLFPSLRLHWPHEASIYRYHFSYGRRIDRPQSAMLNPYSMGEDDMNSFIGNPLLRPEISHQLEFGVERVGSAATVVATPFVRTASNAIRPLKAVTESGRSTTTLRNLERSTAAGTDLNASLRVAPFASILLGTSVYYLTSRAAEEVDAARNSGVYHNLRVTVDVRLADHTGLQLYAFRRSAQPVEQGEMLPVNGTELAISRRFGKEQRGMLALRLSDPFNSSKLAFRVSDPGFTQFSERKTTSRMAVLSLSWNVGQDRAAEAAAREKEAQIF